MAGIVLSNLAGYTWGITSDEAGINIQSFENHVNGKKFEVSDRQSRYKGRADFAFKAEYTIEGFTIATTGLSADTIGALITIANQTALGGISATGAAFLDDITLKAVPGEPQKVTAKVTVYNDILNSVTQITI